MDRRQYTDRVLTSLRRVTAKEREAIRQELDGHMEDHMESLRELGYEEEEAEERTLAAMGDPAEVGRELNRQYPFRWLVVKWGAILMALLLVLAMAPTLFQRVPGALGSLQARWLPKTALDISQVWDDFDSLGVPAVDVSAEAVVRDVHFRVYQLGYRGREVLLAVACWRDNPLLEQLNELDGSFLKPYVNGDLEGYVESPGGNINLYEIRASPGDLLTLTWEVYGETDTVELQLPEEVTP